MLFCRANTNGVNTLKDCMYTFARWSGQVINPSKSFLHFSRNVQQHLRLQIVDIMRIQAAYEPGTYLGLPLSIPRSKAQVCKEIEEKISNRLSGWKERSLSQAGRTVLIQVVASAIPSHDMSIFMLPKMVCRRIDTKLKNFWWGFDDTHIHYHRHLLGTIFAGPSQVGALVSVVWQT